MNEAVLASFPFLPFFFVSSMFPSPLRSVSSFSPFLTCSFSPLFFRSYFTLKSRYNAVPVNPVASTSTDSTLLDSPLFNKFINKFMRDGRRGPAERAVLSSFSALKTHTNRNPHTVFLEMVESLRPLIGLMKRNAGSVKLGEVSNVLVPVPLKERRQVILALTWLRECILQAKRRNTRRKIKQRGASRKKGEWDIWRAAHSNQQLDTLMKNELLRNAFGHSELLKKKSDWYAKVAENRTYVNFRWV
jgi:ribosomal protein S7